MRGHQLRWLIWSWGALLLSVFFNLTCSPHVQTRSKGGKSFAYSVIGWRWMWLHGFPGSETWHLIALRYSAFQVYIKDHLGCHTYQTCEVAFDPLSSWNRTRYLHFGWDQPLIPCLHVHKPMLWTGSICAECGVWGERTLSHPQRREERDVLCFASYKASALMVWMLVSKWASWEKAEPSSISYGNTCTIAMVQVRCCTSKTNMRKKK